MIMYPVIGPYDKGGREMENGNLYSYRTYWGKREDGNLHSYRTL